MSLFWKRPTDKSTGKTSGSKTFEYPFIPRSHGEFTLDPVQYSYYDVSAKKYVTLTSPPLTVKVSRGNESVPQLSSGEGETLPGASRKDVRNLGNDIRYIATATPSFARKGSFFCFSPLFWILLVLLLAAAVAVWALLRGLAARRADVAGTRNRGAMKMARRRLSQAGEFLQKNLYTAFYEELHKALLGYVSDKLNIDPSELSKDHISESLLSAGVSEAHAGDFTALLDACEYARYSPDSGHEAMNAHYESALETIASIENDMKNKASFPAKTALMAVLLLSLPLASKAAAVERASADSLWTAGVEAYAAGQWDTALDAWTAIVGTGVESADLYSNIGDAWF